MNHDIHLLADMAVRIGTMLGRPGMVPVTRELIPRESYRFVYEITGDTVWILTLVHTARQWPPVRDD
jgi:plasmid stabilization system protein ParE